MKSPDLPDTLSQSNSLTDLAARIRVEHEATATALKRSVEHAIAAGALLLEAKGQVPHGQWLLWLTEHCALSERSAQLYMRIAKNRAVIEEQIRNDVADLNLNQAVALLALTSDIRQLFDFARRAEGLSDDPDALVNLCIAEGFAVVRTPDYNPFAGRSEAEIRDWRLYWQFLGGSEGVSRHIEWLLQRPFQSVDEWLGEAGEKFRRSCGMPIIPQETHCAWLKMKARQEAAT